MINKFLRILPRENILQNVPLKNLTSFKIGGNADFVINIDNKKQLTEVMDFIKKDELKFCLLGNGSNILASDRGYKGVIIKLQGDFLKIKIEDSKKNIVKAGAGARLRNLVNFVVDESLAGMECLAGIPGTVGGAIYMNAGAYGGEIKDVIVDVEAFDIEDFSIYKIPVEELQLGYRKSLFQNNRYVILSANLKLNTGDRNKSLSIIEDLMKKRKEKQPVSIPSAGSFFKRPEGYFAGKLIEDSGLKGFHVGDAKVSTLHSGFIVNNGNAEAEDVVKLMKVVQKKVYEREGILLEPEVRFLGEFEDGKRCSI